MILDDASTKFEVIRGTLSGEDNLLSIKALCEIAGVSRSGYYRWLNAEPYRSSLEGQDRLDFKKILEAYIPYNGVFCYLSTVLDAFTKQILSYMLSESLEIDFVLETVNQLIADHGVSLQSETLIHSDQGCHYTSYKFIQIVKDSNLRQSMSRRGNCWDNAPQESFFGHMKDEIDLRQCRTFSEVKSIIDDWMDYYNNERYHWQLAKLSPNEYYQFITTGIYPLPVRNPHKLST